MIKLRTYEKGEPLPEKLRTGMETAPMCDAMWIFIAERNGRPVAIVYAAPAHIMVVLLRLAATDDAEVNDVRALLVYVTKEIKSRGYKGYCTWVDPTLDAERALLGIIRADGGEQLTMPQVACVGRV